MESFLFSFHIEYLSYRWYEKSIHDDIEFIKTANMVGEGMHHHRHLAVRQTLDHPTVMIPIPRGPTTDAHENRKRTNPKL